MNKNKATKWDQYYHENKEATRPCRVLRHHEHLLPQHGFALDLACGLAGNAFYMASLGLKVHAVDISKVAIDKVNQQAESLAVSVKGITRDIESDGLMAHHYDVIVVSYFLDRTLIPEIINRLKVGGLLFYQTWTQQKVADIGPKNSKFLLDKGELLDLCKSLDIVHYHEEGIVGNVEKGLRNQAEIIAIR